MIPAQYKQASLINNLPILSFRGYLRLYSFYIHSIPGSKLGDNIWPFMTCPPISPRGLRHKNIPWTSSTHFILDRSIKFCTEKRDNICQSAHTEPCILCSRVPNSMAQLRTGFRNDFLCHISESQEEENKKLYLRFLFQQQFSLHASGMGVVPGQNLSLCFKTTMLTFFALTDMFKNVYISKGIAFKVGYGENG